MSPHISYPRKKFDPRPVRGAAQDHVWPLRPDHTPVESEVVRPTIETDAYEDGTNRNAPIIFLAGPIKHWWTCWGSPEHQEYLRHRQTVREILIEKGYLTYAPWDAIKGTWDDRAQEINDAAIRTCDILVMLTPYGVPADGTRVEAGYAKDYGVPIIHITPDHHVDILIAAVDALVGPGVSYGT